MKLTQRQINEIIRVKFNEEVWNTVVGPVPTIDYYNDQYNTGNRRKIFKVHCDPIEYIIYQQIWENVKNYINNIDPGWQVVTEGGYVALVKYEKKQQPKAEELTESYKERVRKSTDTLFNVVSSIAESIKSLGYNADDVYNAIDIVDSAINKHLNSL